MLPKELETCGKQHKQQQNCNCLMQRWGKNPQCNVRSNHSKSILDGEKCAFRLVPYLAVQLVSMRKPSDSPNREKSDSCPLKVRHKVLLKVKDESNVQDLLKDGSVYLLHSQSTHDLSRTSVTPQTEDGSILV